MSDSDLSCVSVPFPLEDTPSPPLIGPGSEPAGHGDSAPFPRGAGTDSQSGGRRGGGGTTEPGRR